MENNTNYVPKKRQKYIGKLKERNEYLFLIQKEVKFEGADYYLLTDPYGDKHLIRQKYYTEKFDYFFVVGDSIKCYVDKINCSGEVFIEPAHSFYKLYSIHQFDYVRHDKRTNKQGKNINLLVVVDKYNRECTILPQTWQIDEDYEPDVICCQIERVKKGQLYLENLSEM